MRYAPHILLGAVVCAAGFAYFNSGDSASSASTHPTSTPPPQQMEPPSTPRPPMGGAPEIDPNATALPPNHPPIGPGSPAVAPTMPANDERASITWKVPDGWKVAPNPNAMRIATYRIAPVAGDTDEAEVSISRAGGTTDANIQRWVGQFEGSGKETRVAKTVQGMKVTIVDMSGTYAGGMMPGAASTPHVGWALVGAIVETSGSPYFIKMIGPAKTVRTARPALEKLVDGVTPAP